MGGNRVPDPSASLTTVNVISVVPPGLLVRKARPVENTCLDEKCGTISDGKGKTVATPGIPDLPGQELEVDEKHERRYAIVRS